MLKRVFLARFEPVVACFGPRKIPKCLENGPFPEWRIHSISTSFPTPYHNQAKKPSSSNHTLLALSNSNVLTPLTSAHPVSSAPMVALFFARGEGP